MEGLTRSVSGPRDCAGGGYPGWQRLWPEFGLKKPGWNPYYEHSNEDRYRTYADGKVPLPGGGLNEASFGIRSDRRQIWLQWCCGLNLDLCVLD